MPVRPEIVSEGLGDLAEPLHQHHGLDELHVTELWVPVDVGRAHQDVLTNLLSQENDYCQTSFPKISIPNKYNELEVTMKPSCPLF